jgi:hypothetical protein
MIDPARYDAVPEADRLEQTQPTDSVEFVADIDPLVDPVLAWDADDADRIDQAVPVPVYDEGRDPGAPHGLARGAA